MNDLRARLRIEGDASSAVAAGGQLERALGGVREGAGQAGRALDTAGRQSNELGRSSTTAAGGVGRLDRELGQTASSSARAATGLDRAADRTDHLNRSAGQARGALGLMSAGLAAIGGVAFAREITDAATASAGLTLGMGAVTGGAQEGARELRFAADEADRLGLVAQEASRSLVALGGATKGTVLQGQATRDIWLSVSEAGMALGRTQEQVGRGLTAIEQIAGKGVVSMEEVRQQLAEAIPGAVQIAARAMNMTTQEFDKLVSKGDLLATDFLPKFAAQLRTEYGPAIEAYLTTPMGKARVEMARFETQTRSLSAASGQEFMTGITAGMAKLNAELATPESLERAERLGAALADGVNLAADAAIVLSDNLDLVVAAAQAVAGVALTRWLATTAAEARGAAAAYILKGQAARTAAAEAAAGAAQETVALNTVRGAIIAAAQAEASAAAGQVAATQARLAHAQATLAQVRAEQANASSGLTRAQRLAAVTAAEVQATAATNAHTAALARQQVADSGLAKSKTLLGQAAVGARAGMSSLLGLVGGPWGAAFLAAAAAVMWTTKAIQEQEAKFRDVKASVSDTTAAYKAADAAQKALGLESANVVTAQDQAAVATASLTGEVDKLTDANYRAAASAKALIVEQLRAKAVIAGQQATDALENFNTVRAANRGQAFGSMAGGGRGAGPAQVTNLYDTADRKTLASEEYRIMLAATANSNRANSDRLTEEARGLVNFLPETVASSGGGADKNKGKGKKSSDRSGDVLADLKLEAQAYREHAIAAVQGEAALDAWKIADAGRQAVARAGIEPTSKAAETIRKEAEDVERLGLASDRIAQAASLQRQAVADTAALERRTVALAGGRQAVEALRVTEAGLDVLTRQRVTSLDQLAPAERAAAEAAMQAAEAKERQAIATEKAEAAAGAIEDLDRRIAAETRRTAGIGKGATAEVEYARAEYVRQAVEQAGLEITDEAAQAIIRKADALFTLTAATTAAQDADDFDKQLRFAAMSNRERAIALRTEILIKDILAQQQGLAEGTARAQAENRARAEAWAEDWAKATSDVADGMREQFIESGDLAFDDMGKALERQLRRAVYDSLLAEPINMVINAVMGQSKDVLGSILNGGGGGGGGGSAGGFDLSKLFSQFAGSAGGGTGMMANMAAMLPMVGQVAAIAAMGSQLAGGISGTLGGNAKKGQQWGMLGMVPGLIAGLTDKADRPYARADVEVRDGKFVMAGAQAADGGDKDGIAAAGKALADQLNSLSKTFGIDLTKVSGLYTTLGKTEGGNAKALGGDGFFGGAINGVGSLAGQKDVKGLTLGKGVGFSQGQDAEAITEQIIRDTILRAINAGASDLSAAEKRFVAAAESLDEAVTYIEKSRGFMSSIEDGILQFTDPAAFEKKKALDAIEASYQALKTEATAMVSAGLISADVMARLDELKRLQVEDALKKLAGSAGDATSALARIQPGLREWLDRQMLGANAPLNPLEQRNEAFRQYEDVLTRAVAGDGDALSSLTDYADRLLSSDRLATSDASARALLFEEVMADVRALASKSTVDPVAAAIADLGETLSTDPVVAAIENLPAALLPALNNGGAGGGSVGTANGLAQLGKILEECQAEAARRQSAGIAANGREMSDGMAGLREALAMMLGELRAQGVYARMAAARVN